MPELESVDGTDAPPKRAAAGLMRTKRLESFDVPREIRWHAARSRLCRGKMNRPSTVSPVLSYAPNGDRSVRARR